MQQQADEDELGLSSAALAALREFALENNMLGSLANNKQKEAHITRRHTKRVTRTCRRVVQPAFRRIGSRLRVALPLRIIRSKKFYARETKVCIALTGVNPELGQTLASTGLTVWRAAQEMARFMWEHRQWFVGKRVVELGAGLGLCGVLASKLCTGGTVVITDGGDEFTESAMDALRKNLEKNSCNLVAASSPPTGDDGASCARGDGHSGGGGGGAARVVLEKLTWGDHAGFLERYGGGSSFSGAAVDDNDDRRRGTGREGFDFIVAADVIYEEEGVSPLLHTVVDILRLREAGRDGDGSGHGQSQISTAEAAAEDDQQRKQQSQESGLQEQSSTTPPAVSTFLLAFARRNISIERVLEEAESLGLAWRLPDDFEPASASENVYLMTLR